jgi:hypothetical protein
MSMTAETDRLRGLVEAGIALSSELSLDDLLQKLAETAAALTGARYAALGVIDQSGTALERFLHTGIDADDRDEDRLPPARPGILGALITDAAPLRLESITDDPRSVGFPPNHPPMRGFLGVPILLRGRAFGNLYLTEKHDGVLHRRRPGARRDAGEPGRGCDRERAALRGGDRVVGAARGPERGRDGAGERDRARAAARADRPRLRELIGARLVTIALPAGDGTLRSRRRTAKARRDRRHAARARGLEERPVLERRRAERIDSLLDDPEVDQESARRLGAAAGSTHRSSPQAGRSA